MVETYFAWIPLLGSATGNILGGLLSDRFVAAKTIDKDEKLVAKSELESPINGSSELSPTDEATLTPTQSPEFPAYSDNNSPMTKQDDSVRMLLSGIGGFLALPLVISALLLDKPWCFIIMIGSGLVSINNLFEEVNLLFFCWTKVGELYLGQSLAIIAGPTAVPATLVTQSVALFMFIVTIIGGNMPLLIPSVASVLQFSDATITFTASVAYSPGKW